MGGIVTKDLSQLSKTDISELITSIGPAYSKYNDKIIENEIDGSTLSMLSQEELTEAFKDLGVSVLHSAKIRSELNKLKNNTDKEIDNNNGTDDKFSCPVEYFIFGTEQDFYDGLSGKVTQLTRSMEDECTTNENGKWKQDYQYVVYESASEKIVDKAQPQRVRDKGNEGKTLNDFCDHDTAKDAKLTEAEVASLRMYTGPFYVPWNTSLRTADSNPSLLHSWQTCISVLYSAVVKLSQLVKKKGTVYRGVNESIRKIDEKFYKAEGDNLAGGIELGFMSTSTDKNVALEYARRGSTTDCTIFSMAFDMTSKGASVQWVSQFPYENELLYPPLTSLTCEKWETIDNVKHIYIKASISTMRPVTTQIIRVTDCLIESHQEVAASSTTSNSYEEVKYSDGSIFYGVIKDGGII